MPQEFDENPGPLRTAAAACEHDLARLKPATSRRRLGGHHRRITHDRERSHRPAKQGHGHVQVVAGIAPGGAGDGRQPDAVTDRDHVAAGVEQLPFKALLPSLPQVFGQRLEQGIGPPAGCVARRVTPLDEPVEHLLRAAGLVVAVEPGEDRDRAREQLLPDGPARGRGRPLATSLARSGLLWG